MGIFLIWGLLLQMVRYRVGFKPDDTTGRSCNPRSCSEVLKVSRFEVGIALAGPVSVEVTMKV